MSKFSQSEIREAVNDMNNNDQDPTNFAARTAQAQAINAAWHRAHPSGWATTPAYGIKEARALAYERIRLNRELTTEERAVILKKFSGS
jgi:hypothetical protein